MRPCRRRIHGIGQGTMKGKWSRTGVGLVGAAGGSDLTTEVCRTTAAGVCSGWVIDVPDTSAQLRVTAVTPVPGGFVRIEGLLVPEGRAASYLLSPSAPVDVRERS